MSTILIAEDETRIAAFLQKGLQKNGFTTAIAPDGQQAIDLARSGNFDLILLDLGLPIRDGWSVLHELRRLGLKRPIIVVTARDENQCRAAAVEFGANDYITKPFQFEELLRRIQAQLNQRSDESLANS